jgi:ATP-binding cassette subfamily B protein
MATIPIIIPYIHFKWSQSKMRFEKEYYRATKRRWSNYFVSILTNHKALPEIKILKIAKLLISRHQQIISEFIKQDRNIYFREFTGTFIYSVIIAIVFYALFTRVSWLVIEGRLTVGDVAMFAGATKQLFNLLTSIADQVSMVMEEALYIDNIITFKKTEPAITSSAGKALKKCEGKIQIKNLYFSYPGSRRPILSDLSLDIEAGETVALVGRNGAGKTTLVKLIARLYDPDKGCILLDGVDIKALSIDYLRDQISFVFQDGNRYEATASENIAYGDWDNIKSKSQIEKIAHIADVDKMIKSMPDAYETMLGRKFGEYDISGGQWQKISIARSIAKQHSSVFILDEHLKGLDMDAQNRLIAHFKQITGTRTSIIISHLSSSIRLADRILFLNQGRITETGTHEQLIALGGEYAAMYNIE